jgi:hypothetical protein
MKRRTPRQGNGRRPARGHGVVHLLSQSEHVCRLRESTAAHHALKLWPLHDVVENRKKDICASASRRRETSVRGPAVTVKQLSLAQEDERGEETRPLILRACIVGAQGGKTLDDELDDGDFADAGADGGLVASPACGGGAWRGGEEVTCCEGEDGAEEGRVGAGDDGDDELEVAIWVGDVELGVLAEGRQEERRGVPRALRRR